jgi:hypothetical protein
LEGAILLEESSEFRSEHIALRKLGEVLLDRLRAPAGTVSGVGRHSVRDAPRQLLSGRGHAVDGVEWRILSVTPRSAGRSRRGAEQWADAVAGVLHGCRFIALGGGQAACSGAGGDVSKQRARRCLTVLGRDENWRSVEGAG